MGAKNYQKTDSLHFILETLSKILVQVKGVYGWCVNIIPCRQYILASSTHGKGFHVVHGGLGVRILQVFVRLFFNLEGQVP